MNLEERKYRFTEIISSVHLQEEDDDNPLLPQLVAGLTDRALTQALICQTLKEDSKFQLKFINALVNSALERLTLDDTARKPNTEEIHALGLAINLSWSIGSQSHLLGLCGLAGKLVDTFPELTLPMDFSIIFRPNTYSREFNRLDPYRLLGDNQYSKEEMEHLAEEVTADFDKRAENSEGLFNDLIEKIKGGTL